MKTFRVLQVIAACALCSASLPGCTTAYTSAKRAIPEARILETFTRQVPVSQRATCVRTVLINDGLDPSRLEVDIQSGMNLATATPGPHLPQGQISDEGVRAAGEIGFSTARSVEGSEKAAKHIMRLSISSFTPLTKSISGRDDLDLVFVEGDREQVVAWGEVSVTAIIFSWNGRRHEYWNSARTVVKFYQTKNRKSLNFAMTSGMASAGQGWSRIQVAGVQDSVIVATHDATISAWANALKISGC